MAVFAYRGRTAGGVVAGELEAPDRLAAVAQLRARGVTATSVQEKKVRTTSFTLSLGKKAGGKVKDKHLAIYTRQFSTMVDAGLPIAQCLTILGEQSESKPLREVTTQIAREVEGGASLADSFRKFPKVFDDLFVNMIQVGESGGVLDVVLQRLSTYIEKAASLKRKVKSAMVYPLTIVTVAILVIIFMMTFVIPTFAQMFKSLGAELPLPTRIVLWLSDFTRRYVLLIIAALGGFVYAVKRYYATDRGSQVIDAIMLKVPIFGPLVRKVAVARFTRTLGTLISSGVPILEALRITARTAGNRVVEKAVMQARAAVTTGRTLAEPLRATPVFPPMVVHMISVGENTGALDQMLGKIADFYDDEVDAAVSALTSLLEPLMIVFLGVVVGGLVVAMYLPIFRMVTLIK
ncbi:MAG TPA: type II secretion system F family protein [candidate division Zixibacteria bacterium]|nr:type II secretion system F family protein [candidate division Zixibacteria bacterium]